MVSREKRISQQPRAQCHCRSHGASRPRSYHDPQTHSNIQEEPSGHVVVKTNGPLDGKFTFTSHESGDHAICLSTNYATWFSHTHLRIAIDIVVGTTRPDVEKDRSHISELAGKVRDLNIKIEDIRREQQYQREREQDFRDLSEHTNARAVWYSLAQIGVLIFTCAWQMRHLKVSFASRLENAQFY
jgi:p24 family protein alpha